MASYLLMLGGKDYEIKAENREEALQKASKYTENLTFSMRVWFQAQSFLNGSANEIDLGDGNYFQALNY